ncbi:Protein F41C3.5 [Aphelenchoides avenae]|nr:Protein F41C3.5 [Aphelenchus avenae]
MDAEKDEIIDLPGLPSKPKFRQYSGYLKASQTRFLHYWYNGGPGCSSMFGNLAEIGPFLLNNDLQTLRENPYTWNKFASVVFIDAPGGVGFSYTTSDDDKKYDDNRTSAENYRAIKDFFGIYPQFRKHAIFLSGESYAGIYIPTLASRIIEGQHDFVINLKGVAIGNGLLDVPLRKRTNVEFFYGHGYVGQDIWKQYEQVDRVNKIIINIMRSTTNSAGDSFNIYDIYRNCRRQTGPAAEDILDFELALEQRSLAEEIEHANATDSPDGSMPFCFPDLATYLNQKDVRKALHVPPDVRDWKMCKGREIAPYGRQLDVIKELQQITDSGIRVLLFYGDTDGMCNFLMGQKFPGIMGLRV